MSTLGCQAAQSVARRTSDVEEQDFKVRGGAPGFEFGSYLTSSISESAALRRW